MSENNASGAASANVPAAQGGANSGTPAADASFKVPDGHKLLSQADYERLTQTENRFKGAQSLYNKMANLGIKDEKSLDSWAPVLQSVNQRGLTPQRLAQLLNERHESAVGNENGSVGDDDRPMTRKELQAELARVQHEERKRMALDEHGRARQSELGRLKAENLKEHFGGEIPEKLKPLVEAMARGMYYDRLQQSQYDEQHPLHGEYAAPLGDRLGEIFGSVKEFKEYVRADALAAIAQQAASGGVKQDASQGGFKSPAAQEDDFDTALTNAATQRMAQLRGG